MQWTQEARGKLTPVTTPITETTDISFHTQFINRCYDEIQVTEEQIQHLKETSAFFPEGWFILGTKQKPIASSITLLSRRVFTEGYLDWIQVHPEERQQGFGKQVVSESIRRILHISTSNDPIITVSGALHNKYKPLNLYTSVGFSDTATWIFFETW